jgi:hypothetical protein
MGRKCSPEGRQRVPYTSPERQSRAHATLATCSDHAPNERIQKAELVSYLTYDGMTQTPDAVSIGNRRTADPHTFG